MARNLPHFTADDLIIDPQDAWQILVFFFGGNAGVSIANLTIDDQLFAQALIVEAVDRSEDFWWTGNIFRSTASPGAGVKAALAKFALYLAPHWLRHCKPKAFKNADIYESVKVTLANNFTTA